MEPTPTRMRPPASKSLPRSLPKPDGQLPSGAISDAFVVEKNVPITFYMNGRNLGSGNVTTENKHLWVICEQEKTPTLP